MFLLLQVQINLGFLNSGTFKLRMRQHSQIYFYTGIRERFQKLAEIHTSMWLNCLNNCKCGCTFDKNVKIKSFTSGDGYFGQESFFIGRPKNSLIMLLGRLICYSRLALRNQRRINWP